MKQIITHEQWEELTPEQRDYYLTWSHQDSAPPSVIYRSFGYLLWFLEVHAMQLHSWWFIQQSEGEWCILFDEIDTIGADYEPELIDVLWKGVKHILDKIVQEPK